jgi:cytochrome c oxidase subunit I+III
MEWAMPMPPPSYNFASQPALPLRHPLWDAPELPATIAAGRHALADAGHGRRETLGTDPVTGRPREVFHLPGSSWLPLGASLLLAALCILLLLKLYLVALAVGAAVAAVLLRWSWLNGGHPCMSGTEHADLPDGLKLHTHTFDGPGLWGMGLTMLADASLYGSLVFGWLFLWTVAPSWQPPAASPIGTWPLLGVAALLGAGRWSMHGVVQRLRGCRDAGDAPADGASTVGRATPALLGSLWTAAGCALAAAAGLVALLVLAPLAPTRSAHDAMLAFLLSFLLLHTVLAAVLSVLQALRVRRGHVGAAAPYEPVVVGSFWSFTAGAAAVAWLAFALLPLAFGR